MRCYWSVKRPNECIAHGPAPCHVKQFQSMPRDLCVIYRRVGRSCLPRDYRENPGFAWFSLPPLVATAREISRLHENGRVMRYDDHREDHTAALTATLLGVKDGDCAVITLDFFPVD